MDLKKNPEADLEKKRNLFMEIGLLISIALVFVAFEWKSYEDTNYDLGQLHVEDVPEEMIPITRQEQPPPPPPPPAPVLNIVENNVEVEEEAQIEETDVTEETQIVAIEQPKEVVNEQEIFLIVESMPAFPGCNGIADETRKQECTHLKITEYVGKNLKYPPIAKDNGISGTVYVSFVVGPDGGVRDAKVLRGIGGGCDEEALRVISAMPKWSPGKQRGKAVSVQYNLPIRFTLRN